MAYAKDRVKIQTAVNKTVAKKIDFFAKRFEVSQSRMAEMMLESCIENESLFMEAASSAAVKKIIKAFGKKVSPVISFESG